MSGPLTSKSKPSSSDAEPLEAIATRAKRGEEAAIGELLVRCEPALQRLAARVCPASDADDAVQEVLWRVSSRVGSLRFTAAFLVWAMRMLLRECIRLHRRAARFVFGAPEEGRVPESTTLDLTRALSALDADSREVVIQCDVLGLSAGEAAASMGLGLEATKSRLRRARQQLRVFLEGTPPSADVAS